MARLTTGLGAAQFNIFGDSVHPNSPFAKSQVRQAIGYAIDKQTICDTLLPGVSAPTEQWGMPGSWSYNPNFAGFKYDPAKAKQLLADAGYPNGFKTNFLVQNAPAQVDLATAIQGYLSKVGIQVNLDPADTARLSPFKYQQAWPEGLIMGAIKVDADVAIQMRNVVHSGGALYTFGMIHPQEIDDLINKALTIADVNSKEGVNRQLQQLVFDKYALFTPIYVQLVVSAKYPDVQNDNFNAVEATMWSPESTWLGKAA
jgi:peptide/nickel transport system substrate-binding protein